MEPSSYRFSPQQQGALRSDSSFSYNESHSDCLLQQDLSRVPPHIGVSLRPARTNADGVKRSRSAVDLDSSKRSCGDFCQIYTSQEFVSPFDLHGPCVTFSRPSTSWIPGASDQPSAPPALVRDLSCCESDVFSDGASNSIDDEALSFCQANASYRLSSTPITLTSPGGYSGFPSTAPAHDQPAAPAPAFVLPPIDPELTSMMNVICCTERAAFIDASYLTTRHGSCSASSLDSSMRAAALSWLVEVCQEFCLVQETLHLGAALLDRFLSATRAVPRSQLQLLAVTCLLIAAKHEEEALPSIYDLASVADNCFTPNDILRMECIVLSCLEFRITCPTAHTFLSLIKGMLDLHPAMHSLASYLIELSILEYDMLDLLPSQLASGAVAIAAITFNDARTRQALPMIVPGASVAPVVPCMRRLLALQLKAAAISAVETDDSAAHCFLPINAKFSTAKWNHVALHAPCSLLVQELATVTNT